MVNPEAGGRGVSLVLTWADGSCRRPADGLAPPFRPREIWHCSSPPVNQRAITTGLQSCGSFPLCGMRPDFHRPEESRNAPNHPQQAQHHPLHICTVIIDFKADFRPVGAFYGELRGFGHLLAQSAPEWQESRNGSAGLLIRMLPLWNRALHFHRQERQAEDADTTGRKNRRPADGDAARPPVPPIYSVCVVLYEVTPGAAACRRVDRGVGSPAPHRSGRARLAHPALRTHGFAAFRKVEWTMTAPGRG